MSDDATTAPAPLDRIKADLRAQHKQAVDLLHGLRRKRDALNAEIRNAVKVEADTARIIRALEPRARRKT